MPKFEGKQVVIDEIKEKLLKAKSAVLLDARGLTVAQDTDFRKKLRTAGIEYKVYKNTMMTFAVEGTEFEGFKEYLKGPSSLALSYNESDNCAGIIKKSSKDLKALEFKAGIVESVLYDADKIRAIADIPPREELLSKLLGSFKSPLSSFARIVTAIAEKGGEPEAVME